jgi:hypothetical protein
MSTLVHLEPTDTGPEGAEARGAGSGVGPVTVVVEGPGPAIFGTDILLGSLGDARLRVQKPIRMRFTTDMGQVVAEADEIDEFGFGADIVSARLDLQRAIVELYFSLEHDQARLGADLRRVWDVLRGAISRAR